eukprot:6472664-Amphidinium_carterae.1
MGHERAAMLLVMGKPYTSHVTNNECAREYVRDHLIPSQHKFHTFLSRGALCFFIHSVLLAPRDGALQDPDKH